MTAAEAAKVLRALAVYWDERHYSGCSNELACAAGAAALEREAAMQAEVASANRECEVRNERELGYLARAQSAEAEVERLRAELQLERHEVGDTRCLCKECVAARRALEGK